MNKITFHIVFQYNVKITLFFTCREKVDELKVLQKLRERPKGVNIVGLALGEKVTKDFTCTVSIKKNA